MKKILPLLAAITILLGAASCRKLPLHGDFSGMWQILTIEYPDGTVKESNHDYYYCFNRHVVMLRQNGNGYLNGNLTYNDTDFTLQFFDVYTRYLAHWGITLPEGMDHYTGEVVINYTIDKLTSKQLIVTTEQGVTITMRKY